MPTSPCRSSPETKLCKYIVHCVSPAKKSCPNRHCIVHCKGWHKGDLKAAYEAGRESAFKEATKKLRKVIKKAK